jgi:hypothetical protein
MASRSRRTKEYVSIIRQIFAREKPLEHKGEHYQIPYTGPGATGLGKPLKTIIHPSPNLKIYTASIASAGLRTAAEVADGVLPFPMSPEQFRLHRGRRDQQHAAGERASYPKWLIRIPPGWPGIQNGQALVLEVPENLGSSIYGVIKGVVKAVDKHQRLGRACSLGDIGPHGFRNST